MAKEKVRLWDRLKYKYKLSVINETSYEEVFNFRLSQLHVLTALSVLAVILVVLTILLIAFTGLREFIPGYPDGNMRQMIAQNALRVDSLENELLKRDRFFKSIRLVLNGGDTTSLERSREDTARYRNDTIRFQISEQENEFRAAIEERERFNQVVGMLHLDHISGLHRPIGKNHDPIQYRSHLSIGFRHNISAVMPFLLIEALGYNSFHRRKKMIIIVVLFFHSQR